MNATSVNGEITTKRLSLALGIVLSLALSIILPLLLVAYEGMVWGGEGLFSFMLVGPIFCFILLLLGVGICVLADKSETKAKRAKVFIFGSIIYISFVIAVFVVMTAVFHEALGPLSH